jgi:5-methylthioadenosine/S-adenosylhomocysteine deaminase
MSWTVIRGGRVLEPGSHRADLADLLLAGHTIREIGPPGLAAPEGATPVDARDRLLIPGLVNSHTHAHGGLAKGLTPDRATLETFLTSVSATTGDRSIEEQYLSALLSAIEMVHKGCTAAYDLCVEYPAPTPEGILAVARAYRDVGMRAVVAPMMADRTLWRALPGLLESVPEGIRRQVAQIQTAPVEVSLAACRAVLRDWPFDRASVCPALGPTIPLHCSDAFLTACRDLAREFDVGVHTHLAETKTQALLGPQKYGKTLTAHLADLGLLGPRLSAAHAIWVSDEDIARLADAGASVAHNPLSNLRLGSGVAPVARMRTSGLRVGIGTDSVSTSDTQNLFEAARLASFLSRIVSPVSAEWLGVEDVLEMASTGSAGVLGMANITGRLAPGFRADLVFLDLSHIGYVPLNDPVLQLVNGESGAAVDKVMIDGRMVMDGRRLLTVNEEKVRDQAERSAARLKGATAEKLAFARSLERYVAAFCVAHAQQPWGAHRSILLDS